MKRILMDFWRFSLRAFHPGFESAALWTQKNGFETAALFLGISMALFSYSTARAQKINTPALLVDNGVDLRVKAPASLNVSTRFLPLQSYDLEVGCNKTCMLVFPTTIQSADRGAAYVLAEREAGSENVLKVKAGKPGFLPSSLTVITADGQIFSFKVFYKANPSYLVLTLKSDLAVETKRPLDVDKVQFAGGRLNSAAMDSAMQKVLQGPDYLHGAGVHERKYGLRLSVTGIYYLKNLLFFKLRLQSEARMPYLVDSLRIFVRDKKTTRRTAVADHELRPLAMRSEGSAETDTGKVILVALPRFSIADNKQVAVILTEKQGDRTLCFYIRQHKMKQIRLL